MKVPNPADVKFVSIVPVDEMTRAMLAYAKSPEGHANIIKARHELADGKGIVVTPEYFEEMNHRISKRVSGAHSIEA